MLIEGIFAADAAHCVGKLHLIIFNRQVCYSA